MIVNVKLVYNIKNKTCDSSEDFACRKIADFFDRLVFDTVHHTDVEICVSYNENDYYFIVDILMYNADNLIAWDIKKHIDSKYIYIKNYGTIALMNRWCRFQ